MKLKSTLWSLLTVFALSMAGCSDDDDNVVTPTPQPEPQPGTELTFTMNVSNITSDAADIEVIPSALDKTYYADVVATVNFAGKTEQEMIDLVLKNSNKDDLLSGKLTLNHADMAGKLNPETSYTLYALGFNEGKVTSEFFTKEFKTLKAEQPEPQPEAGAPAIELTSRFNKAENALQFVIKCTSKNAQEGKAACTESAQIDQILAAMPEVPVEDIYQQVVDEMGKPVDMELLNNSEVVISRKDKEAGTMFTTIVVASNEKGKTLKTLKAKFEEGTMPEPEPQPEQDIAKALKAYLTPGDANGLNPHSNVTAHFTVENHTLDCQRSYATLFVVSELDAALANGQTIEKLIMKAENNQVPDALIFAMNDRGEIAHQTFSGLLPSTEYTFAWLAYDYDGNKGIIRSDAVATSAEDADANKGPQIQYMAASATNIYGFGADHSASCLINSKEATKGMVCCIETNEYFELSKTMSAREIIEKKGKDLTAEEIRFVAASKLQLVGNFDKLKASTSYRYGVLLFNAAGYATVAWGDIKTAAPLAHGNDVGCPAVKAEGWAGDAEKKFPEARLTVKLQGAEVTGASIINFEAELIHTLFKVGCDAREIIDQMSVENPDFVTYASAEDVKKIQGDGWSCVMGGIANKTYTPIWRCYNAAGKVCVGSFDITLKNGSNPDPTPDPDPTPGPTDGEVKVEVTMVPGDLNGESTDTCMRPIVKSPTKNVDHFSILMTFQKEIDDELAAGKKLYDIVNSHPKTDKPRMDWNAGINRDGCTPFYYEKQKNGEHYSYIVIAWNSKGDYGMARVDWEFQGANTKPQNVPVVKMAKTVNAAELAVKNFMVRATAMTEEVSVDEFVRTVTRLNFGEVINEEKGLVFKKLNIKKLAARF